MLLDLSKPHEVFKAGYVTFFLQDGHVYAPNGHELTLEELIRSASPIDFPLLYKRLGLINDEQYELLTLISLRDSIYMVGGVEAGITPDMVEEKIAQKLIECGISANAISDALEELKQQVIAEYQKEQQQTYEQAQKEAANMDIEMVQTLKKGRRKGVEQP